MLQYTKYSKMKCSLTRTEICFQNNHYVLVECDKNRKDRNRDEGGRKPPRVALKHGWARYLTTNSQKQKSINIWNYFHRSQAFYQVQKYIFHQVQLSQLSAGRYIPNLNFLRRRLYLIKGFAVLFSCTFKVRYILSTYI